jgi:small subunit ribosomal protein S1
MATIDVNKSPAVLALKQEFSNFTWPRENLVVEGTLIKKEARRAYFDLGRFGTGIVYGVEYLNARDMLRDMKPGTRVSAKVVLLDGEGGCIEMSLTEASRQKVWQQAQDLLENGEITKVKITAANPGGLVAALGDLKAFLPLSQLSTEHMPAEAEADRTRAIEALAKFVGQEFEVKVINVNPKKNKLIVSERETVSVNMKELLSVYTAGQIVDGLVSGIADFGIFVRFAENPQIEGLVHISEIDHRIIDSPKEMVSMNEEVKVKILDIKDGKVFLSLKALKPDPWATLDTVKFTAGREISGTVYKFNPFGAVINLGPEMQGVIHVTEFGGLDEMKTKLTVGQEMSFIIDSVKPEEKRILLKLKK